ncbi:MAG TPA: hypothetical protein VJ810_00345 [Blastocatellia bacterium]|nr:hypothetical protein [Blastocatellia bacterium]
MILYFGLVILGLSLYTLLFYLFLLWRLATAPNDKLHHRVFMQDLGDHSQLRQFSYYHILKALRSIKLTMPAFQGVGCREEEFRSVLPILLHTESLIYVTDLDLEESLRKSEAYADPPLKKEIARFLGDYGLYDDKIAGAVEDLRRYAAYESQIMLNQIEITDERIRELCFRRGCDIYLMLRILCRAKNLPYPEDYLYLEQHLTALGEIQDDLSSYQKDVQENSVNVLRLCVRRHGTEKALEKLRELATTIVDESIRVMKNVDKRHLANCAAAYFEIDWGIPFVLARPLFACWPRFILVAFMKRYVMTVVMNTVFANAPRPIEEEEE